jgi:NAD+ kinase
MSERVGRVALVTHQVPAVSAEALAQVVPLLRARGIEVLLPPGERAKHPELLAQGGTACCDTRREDLAEADLCLVLGGDGTMLRALRQTRDLGLPVAGINLGRVGFFAAVARDAIAADLPRVLDGEYGKHPLLGLAAQLNGAELRAVNDLSIGRGREGGIARIAYALNGVALFDVACDALIVSTPAGSSAYNLAVGGPLMGIGVDAFVLSYVAPHALGTRSLVAAASDVLTVTNRSPHDPAEVVVDGEHMGTLLPLASMEIRTVPALACLALLPESSFYRQFSDRFIRN